ncbi:MAG: pancreas/duodenum homeobox protein 1 [Pseudomonadota bacterium]
MSIANASTILTDEKLATIFPASKTNDFFDALYGDAEDGAYDIRLTFISAKADRLELAFALDQRPNQCLRCNLTYGLPQVFARHPIIGVAKVVEGVAAMLGLDAAQCSWELGRTQEHSEKIHTIPLSITVKA